MTKISEEKAKIIAKIAEGLDNELTQIIKFNSVIKAEKAETGEFNLSKLNIVETIIDLYEKEKDEIDRKHENDIHELACKIANHIIEHIANYDYDNDASSSLLLANIFYKFYKIDASVQQILMYIMTDEKVKNAVTKVTNLVKSMKKDSEAKDLQKLIASIEDLLCQFNKRKDELLSDPQNLAMLQKATSFDTIINALKPYLGSL